MTDSKEIDERVAALIELLVSKDVDKIKEVGDEIVDAAGDDEPWFEPEQMMDMMNKWLDACIAKLDDEALNVTSKAIKDSKVEDDKDHPGFAKLLQKIAQALDTPGAPHMEYMLMVRFATLKWGGDLAVYPALGELMKHKEITKIHDAVEILSNKFYQLHEGSDAEAEAVLTMAVDVAKSASSALSQHKPGDMEISNRLANQLKCLGNVLGSAYLFCTMLAVAPGQFPKGSNAIAEPGVIMELQEALEAVKPKPKEQELKEAIGTLKEHCQNLLGSMPKPTAGKAKASNDPTADAKRCIKGLQDAKDTGSIQGIMTMMTSSTDAKALDVVLGKEALEALVAAIERVKKSDYDQMWQSYTKFLVWAVETRPASLEPVSDKLIGALMSGPPLMTQPKQAVDAFTERAPSLALKVWAKFSVWQTAVEKMKGSQVYDGNLYQVITAVESLPRALEGSDLEAFCRKMVELAQLAKGSQMEDSVKCFALQAMRSVVSKDKSKVPKDVLEWVQTCKNGDGTGRDAAVAFMDAYEGRSLENAYNQIAEANQRFKEACGDLEGLKAYVDENVADLKDFVGTVTKKLPLPCKFSSEARYVVRMAMLLHFQCQASPKTKLCALPGEEDTFTTETLEWNRWLKLGLSAAKLGKSIISADCVADVGGAVDQVKEMYKTYSKKDDAAFLQYISEPFLTSDEQDQLLKQLRTSGFFDKFAYDAQTGNWYCANCYAVYANAGRDRCATALEAAAAEVESSVPLKVGDINSSNNNASMANNVKDAAMDANFEGISKEVNNNTSACCSFFGMCVSNSASSGAEIVMPPGDSS